MSKALPLVLGVALLTAAGAASAERVYVKARGEVDLAPFRCESYSRDANVRRLCYDERAKYALVSIRGIWYHYCDVPPSTVSAWRRASAKSRYYNEQVRGSFECTGISMPMYK